VDDITQSLDAIPEGAAIGRLIGCFTSQVVQHVSCVGIIRRPGGIQQVLQPIGETGGIKPEGDACCTALGCDDPAIPV
jgi:hypothetical protein